MTAATHQAAEPFRNSSALPILLLILCTLLNGSSNAATSQKPLTDSDLSQINFDQKLGTHVSPGLQFVDENAKSVRLGEYFGQKPIILLLGYYRCPMLCTLVQNGLIECLGDIRWSIGKEYEAIYVSIDPAEAPALAAGKKRSSLKRYGRSEAEAGWHFLTGGEPAIKELARQVGFHYAYDPVARQYAHPSGLVVLTPEGKISHYFFGVTFPPNEVLESLQTASKRSVGARVQDLVLLCFHYRPITGRYGKAIIISTRALGIATVLGIASFIVTGVRRKQTPSSPHLPAYQPINLSTHPPPEGRT